MYRIDVATLPVLLVDDEPQVLHSASIFLRSCGFLHVQTLTDARALMTQLDQVDIGVLVLDLTMPHVSGDTLLKQVAAEQPDVPVIVMTANNDLKTAVHCMQSGAIDYLLKPVDGEQLVAAVRRGMEIRSLRAEVFNLKKSLLDETPARHTAFDRIITQDPAMLAILRYVEAIATSPQPVLITGESGTGKELIANALHILSNRRSDMVTLNVAGLDDSLFSDTLFGHTRGAFTGAERAREGLVASAANGTLFLDEIGDLSMASQVKLLRLLQDGSYYPVGADRPLRSQARIIVSTNCNVLKDIGEGRFRKDLYFRLRTHQIELPPLRQRSADLPLLIRHFVASAAHTLDKPVPQTQASLAQRLQGYMWPGNIRELEAICFDAVARNSADILSFESFKEAMGGRVLGGAHDVKDSPGVNWPAGDLPSLDDAENSLIDEVLLRYHGNQTLAAQVLGISRQALNKRLRRRTGSITADQFFDPTVRDEPDAGDGKQQNS